MSTGSILSLFGEEQTPVDTHPADDDLLDSTRLGRYAEFMVCAELTKLGYDVIHVDAPGFDLLLSADGNSWRIQVKSTTMVQEGKCRWKVIRHKGATNGKKALVRREEPYTRRDADLLALFHHQFGTVVFRAIGAARWRGGRGRPSGQFPRIIELPASQVQQHDTAQSLKTALRFLVDDGGD